MKELVGVIMIRFYFKRSFSLLSQIAKSSFKTIPNPLKQFSSENLIILEALVKLAF
jgi:hypothetical protein